MSNLPNEFTATNTETGHEVRFTHLPSGVIGDNGVFRTSWRGANDYLYIMHVYDYDRVRRDVVSGLLKINFQGNNMKLPNIFYFTCAREDDGIVYSATLKGDEYHIGWWSVEDRKFKQTTYTVSEAESAVHYGRWTIKAETFEDTDETLPSSMDYGNFIEEEQPTLLTEDPDHGDLAVDLPPIHENYFDFSALDENCINILDYLYNEPTVTLSEIQEFCSQTGCTVEADGDFFTVKSEFTADFVAGSPSELVEIMQAVRTLILFQDNG